MATLFILVIGLLGWIILGLVVVRVAARAGHSSGYFPRNQLYGRFVVLFQVPALLVQSLAADLRKGGPPTFPLVARGLGALLWNPATRIETIR